MKTREEQQASRRRVIYCIVPRDLAAKLHDYLDRHFRDDPSVEVVIERRGVERRRSPERRSRQVKRKAERRLIRNPGGRRAGERRARQAPAKAPPLPRRAQRHAERLVFVERLEPTGEQAEDLDTARLVIEFQAGDRRRFDDLYRRYFNRVFSYLRLVLDDVHEAEDAAQQVFVNVLEALHRYERRRQPFRAWLFTAARHQALNRLRDLGRIDVLDPAEINRLRELEAAGEGGLEALNWITDKDLLYLVGRLPLPQRQVLVLRYLGDLSAAEIGRMLGRTPEDVRMLQHRAQHYLKERLTALGHAPDSHAPDSTPEIPMTSRVPEATVLRARRFSIS